MSFRAFARVSVLGVFALIPAFGCAATGANANVNQRFDYFEPVRPTDQSLDYPVRSCAVEHPADPKGVLLDVPHFYQQVPYADEYKSNLCWATSIAMVSTSLGNPRMPCQIASYIAGDGLSCCRLSMSSPEGPRVRCNQGAYTTQIASTLHRMGIYHLRKDDPLDEDDVTRELSNGRPIILQMTLDVMKDGKTVEAGHAVVIAGFDGKGKFRVNNPNRRSTDDLTYAELVAGTKDRPWKWIISWYHFSYRPDGCNPRFDQACDCK